MAPQQCSTHRFKVFESTCIESSNLFEFTQDFGDMKHKVRDVWDTMYICLFANGLKSAQCLIAECDRCIVKTIELICLSRMSFVYEQLILC